jgi:large subunit ribosomal protein L32
MIAPKRRISHARRDKRRSSVWKLDPPALNRCGCGALRVPHRVCPECGMYKGRLVVAQAED